MSDQPEHDLDEWKRVAEAAMAEFTPDLWGFESSHEDIEFHHVFDPPTALYLIEQARKAEQLREEINKATV